MGLLIKNKRIYKKIYRKTTAVHGESVVSNKPVSVYFKDGTT